MHIDEGYVTGGEKTEAGKDRIVPINAKIMPFIKEWYTEATLKKQKYLLVNSEGKKLIQAISGIAGFTGYWQN